MLLIVNFHYIRDKFEFEYSGIVGITPSHFRNQLTQLGKHGQFISQQMLVDKLRNGKELPEKAILITFDDGLKEQMRFALPVLEELGIPAIFFVNSSILIEKEFLDVHKIHLLRTVIDPESFSHEILAVLKMAGHEVDMQSITQKGVGHYKYDNPNTAALKYLLNFTLDERLREQTINDLFEETFGSAIEGLHGAFYMGRNDVVQLGEKGYLGSHGHYHLPIGNLEEEEKISEIRKSKAILEQMSGTKIRGFSYPYGNELAYRDMEGPLQAEGYQFAVTMNRRMNTALDAPFYLNRFDNNDVPNGKAYKFENLDPFETLI